MSRGLKKFRDQFGDEIRLRADYNQGLSEFQAIHRIRDPEAFQLDFVEQPVQLHKRDAIQAITRKVDVPIMADESVFDSAEALTVASS